MENIQLNEVTRTGAEVLVDSLQKQAEIGRAHV